ncbi:prolyl aminopeptidase [Rheinheimera sp.]|jgi:proline iminopeptidase|uniref:prolyl aminopeptidase n=1 Tax=Rheinheimera sp. TaxID=1869214 RepID=UPI00261A41D7|nr:prolyl aminopeptidase [Rheinheimera sp.]MCA1931169.1 prolyl aminopeptidase [Rheinheimera sp.]
MNRLDVIEAFARTWLETPDGQRIYLEQSGNPKGIPVIYCHGGPGGGSSPFHRQLFDPALYHIIIFDQRGCGLSTPALQLENNSTQDLIADMELIRNNLGLSRWVVAGGSWGSTLALAYGQAYPHHCLGFILRGIFLGREQDIDWLYRAEGGASQVFPDYYQDFIKPVAEFPQLDILQAYQLLLHHKDQAIRLEAALAWSIWESRIATLLPNEFALGGEMDADSALALALIEHHYFMHLCFFEPDQLLKSLHKISHLPCQIVHGRYDMVCKAENAYSLASRWPGAQLNWVVDAGHSASEDGIAKTLYRASQVMAELLDVEDVKAV